MTPSYAYVPQILDVGPQVKGGRSCHTVDPRNALLQVFSSVNPNETLINLSDGVSHRAPGDCCASFLAG